MRNIGMIMLVMIATTPLFAQTHSEKISKSLSFGKLSDANTVIIANINGSVRVEGYEGSDVRIEVDKTITAKTTDRLEKGKQQIQLGTLDLVDTVVVFIEGT